MAVGWTPLHEASNHGRLGVARELLRAGADCNAQGLDNNSPLHDAAINGHAEVSSTAVSHGIAPAPSHEVFQYLATRLAGKNVYEIT